MDGNRPVRHCVFDETNYHNKDKAAQRAGRDILDSRDAIVLVPRSPLQFGRSYRVVIDTNGRRIDWTFRIGQ